MISILGSGFRRNDDILFRITTQSLEGVGGGGGIVLQLGLANVSSLIAFVVYREEDRAQQFRLGGHLRRGFFSD